MWHCSLQGTLRDGITASLGPWRDAVTTMWLTTAALSVMSLSSRGDMCTGRSTRELKDDRRGVG